MSRRTKLVVHIGTGKTGSTAIQQHCDAARQDLLRQGIAYLGSALEHCGTRSPFDWQLRSGAVSLLHGPDPATKEAEVHSVLNEELARLTDAGVPTALWSNEALFARHEGIIAALERLVAEGTDLSVVVYLRRHDTWSRSAYFQWGIRHKSYRGPVKRFAEWIHEHPVRFGDDLAAWNDALAKSLLPRNYDLVEDVTADLLSLIGARDIGTRRALPTPGPVELTAWAAYNDRFEAEVLPNVFGNLLENAGLPNRARHSLPPPDLLFPTEEDLGAVRDGARDDLNRINVILKGHGEPPLSLDGSMTAEMPPSHWEMLQFLMSMAFSLQERVDELSRRLDDLGG